MCKNISIYANMERSQIISLHPENLVLTALQYCWRCCWMPNSELAGTINVLKVGWCLKKVRFPRLYGLQAQPLCCFPKSQSFYLQYRQKTPASLHTGRLGPSGTYSPRPLFVCLAFVFWSKALAEGIRSPSLVCITLQCYTQTTELRDHGAFL